MAGVLSALAGAAGSGKRIDLPVNSYSWGDKYSAGEQYGADGGYFSSLTGGNFAPANWQGRTVRTIMHEYDFYASVSRTVVSLDGYNATPVPTRLRVNGTIFTLGTGYVAWGSFTTAITYSPSPTNNINWTAHGLAVNDPVMFYCTSAMPSGITASTVYFVQTVVSANAIKISATPGGGAISFTGTGSGTRYGYKNPITGYQANGTLAGNVFAAMLPRAATITIASPAVIIATGHGLASGKRVQFTTTGALPTGLAANTTYFVINAVTDMFNLAATQGGAPIGTSGSQSGSHILREVVSITLS